MVVMDKKYAKQLHGLSDTELTAELYEVVNTIREPSDQRTRDRGSYLVLENIGRVPGADQEGLIRGMLEANPHPSRGVQLNLKGWKPAKMPSAVTLAAIARAIGVDLIECLKNIQHGEISESLFQEVETILVAQDKHDTVALLAEIYAPSRLSQLADQMMARVVELCHEETQAEATAVKKTIREWNETPPEEMAVIQSMPSKGRRERFFRSAVSLSIKHKVSTALIRMRESAELNHGDDLFIADFVDAAVIVGEKKWLEAAIQRVIKSIRPEDASRLARRVFGLVKEDRFAGYRQQLFDAIYKNNILPSRPSMYKVSFLKLLAEMAVYFANKGWQDQVHRAAMKQMPNDPEPHRVYEVFVILALAHEASRQTIASTPRPEWDGRIVLW